VRTVTRMELVDHIEPAFTAGPTTREELLAAATASQARPEVIAVLQRLPGGAYRSLRDLWPELSDVPVSA
jgi:hypothetical protein